MKTATLTVCLLGAMALALPSLAQTSTPSPTVPSTTPAPSASAPQGPGMTGNPAAPVAGANSFTEAQARSRIEEAGFTAVGQLRKDDDGVWRGSATRGGTAMDVALDYRGNVFSGAAASTRAWGTRTSAPAVPGSTSAPTR